MLCQQCFDYLRCLTKLCSRPHFEDPILKDRSEKQLLGRREVGIRRIIFWVYSIAPLGIAYSLKTHGFHWGLAQAMQMFSKLLFLLYITLLWLGCKSVWKWYSQLFAAALIFHSFVFEFGMGSSSIREFEFFGVFLSIIRLAGMMVCWVDPCWSLLVVQVCHVFQVVRGIGLGWSHVGIPQFGFFTAVQYFVSMWLTQIIHHNHMQEARVVKLQLEVERAAEEASAEKEACEALVSMFCDAHLWLSQDARTITACDHRLKGLIGCDTTGKQLPDFFAEGSGDEERLQQVLTRAGQTPLQDTSQSTLVSMLPVTLRREVGITKDITVDMYIVRAALQWKSDREFLVGIRNISGEQEYPDGAPWQSIPEEVEIAFPECPSVVMSMPRSLPTTTPTGHIFQVDKTATEAGITKALFGIVELGIKEQWLVKKTEVKLIPDKCYGSGAFGVVIGATLHGSPVAVKLSKQQLGSDEAHNFPELCNELRILRHLRHPNLVQLFGGVADLDGRCLGLVLEAVDGGSLGTFVRQAALLSRCKAIIGMCSALQYLHSRDPVVVHGDLKSSNILLEHTSSDMRIKILDFGLSRLLTKRARKLGGTYRWMAPEVFLNTEPEPSADVFSCGRVMFFMLAKELPLRHLSDAQIVSRLKSMQPLPMRWPPGVFLPAVPSEEGARSLVDRCLAVHPQTRPPIAQVLRTVEAWVHSLADRHAEMQELSWQDGLKRVLDLPDYSSTKQTALPPAQCPIQKMRIPARFPTELWARQAQLIDLMLKWNYVVGSSCCELHAGLHDIERCLSQIHSQPCRDMPVVTKTQCHGCGLLCNLANNCQMCVEQDADVSSSSALPQATVVGAVSSARTRVLETL